MAEPTAVISKVLERHSCLYVHGYAKTPEGMRKASFVVYKGDIDRMTPEAFEAFALRKLPQVIEGTHYEVTAFGR